MRNILSLIALSSILVIQLTSCLPPSPPTPQPSPNPNPKRWKLLLEDGFKGPGSAFGAGYAYSGHDQVCYDQPLICKDPSTGSIVPCSTPSSHLAGLNKCLWSVGRGLNYMNSADDRHNRFDADHVELDPSLDNGVLIIKGALSGDGTENCKSGIPLNQLSCPYVSGYVDSGAVTGLSSSHGYTQTGGLIQIRSKLAKGSGSWPGLWMLGAGSWPQHGEIDILESEATATQSSQTLHTAACYIPSNTSQPYQYLDWGPCGQAGGTEWHLAKGETVLSKSTTLDFPSTSFANDYHTFAVAWEPGQRIRFATDNVISADMKTGDLHHATSMQDSNAAARNIPMQIPTTDDPMYLILNQSIAWANQSAFTPQDLYVDYVRVWAPCEKLESKDSSQCTFCTAGGTEAGPNCSVEPMHAANFHSGTSYWVDADPRWAGVFYKKVVGACPYGGTASGPNCQIFWFAPGVVETNIKYWVDTTSASPGVYYRPLTF